MQYEYVSPLKYGVMLSCDKNVLYLVVLIVTHCYCQAAWMMSCLQYIELLSCFDSEWHLILQLVLGFIKLFMFYNQTSGKQVSIAFSYIIIRSACSIWTHKFCVCVCGQSLHMHMQCFPCSLLSPCPHIFKIRVINWLVLLSGCICSSFITLSNLSNNNICML